MALRPGDTLFNGQYRILRLLGRGGFGFVYEGQDALLHEQVAIKELIPALVGDENALKRFLAEAKATMRLRHKRIVATYNVFQEGGNYYIVMEYLPGGSLEQRLRDQGPLPVVEAVRVATEVCEGLACAHEEGVVHCDLKPANILFDAKASAKVADFGIAHVSGNMLTRSWQTPSGFVAGTLPYMSPEQVDGVRDDPRVDVYALGAVLHRMLTGRTYLGFDDRETPGAQAQNVLRIQNQLPEPPSAHDRRVPRWLDGIVLKALAKRPEERYATAADLRAALLQKKEETVALPPEVLGSQAPAKQPTARPRPVRPPRSALPPYFWPLVLGAGALLVALVIGVLALISGGSDRATPTATTAAVPQVTHTEVPTGVPLPTNTRVPPTSMLTSALTITPTSTTTPTRVPEPTLVFAEDFSRLDSSKWGADPGSGEITVLDGLISMSSSGRSYPYVYTYIQPFPSDGDFRVTSRLRYARVRDCGVGILVTSFLVPAGLSQAEAARLQEEAEANGVQTGVWQDRADGLQLWFRSGGDRADIPFPLSTEWNKMTIEYSGGRYTLYLNDSKAYTSLQTARRPSHIWLGHPAVMVADCSWDTLEVDYIRVESLP